MDNYTLRVTGSLLIGWTVVATLALTTLAHAQSPHGLPFPFGLPFSGLQAPVKPPPPATPPWSWPAAPRRTAPAQGWPWATSAARAPAMPSLFPTPRVPFTASRPPGIAAPNPFVANPFSNPFSGGYGVGMWSAPMVQGASSIMAPMAMNYAIASLNPTTFNNFLGLMMRPQPMGQGIATPFGLGQYPAAQPFGFVSAPPVVANPFASLFVPWRGP